MTPCLLTVLKPFTRLLTPGAAALLAAALQAAVLLAAGIGAARADAPAFRADQFTDFVGINGGPLRLHVIPDGPYAGAGRTPAPALFYDLGIRYYRTGLFNDLTPPDQPEQVRAAWAAHGVRPMLLIDSGKTATADAVLDKLRRYAPGSVAEVEGPNEVNNKFPPQDLNIKYGGKTDEAGGAAFLTDVYRAVKADPATRALPLVAYTAIFTDYHLARPCAAFDFANMHSYQGYDVPSSSLLMNETRANNLLPAGATIKPFVPTECGYNVQPDRANGTNGTGSRRAQALNLPMLLAEYFRHGIRRAYLFALQNADGYGLLDDDMTTRRPSYFALRNLLAAVKDSAWNPKMRRWSDGGFAPRALRFGLDNAPPTVHTLTLQKRNGEYLLLVWNEVRNFDENSHQDIVNAPVPVTLRLQTPVQGTATALTQNPAGGYDVEKVPVSHGTLSLAVPASVMIVRLTTHPAAPSAPPAPPRSVRGTATENAVHLAWLPPRGRTAPAGYFVFRNGGFLADLRGTSFDDRSAWVRPGLGYVYTVQAYDRAGGLSAPARAVVVTPDRRPDLVCAGVVVPAAKAGERVVFRGTLQNIGDGATPQNTVTGLTFFVDGRYTAYATTDGTPLAPGESRALVTDGGPEGGHWTAAAGAHLLRVLVDDINRVPDERSKKNNTLDRSLWVDVHPPGLLLGAADPAPGQADLTAEGTRDWVQWGLGGPANVTRKASGGGQIGGLAELGSGTVDATSGFGMGAGWSDGAPTAHADSSHAALWLNGVGHGWRFAVPAGVETRVLRVYVGGIEGAGCLLTAHLSDGSAPDYVSRTDGNLSNDWSPVPGGFTGVYTLRYHAAAPGGTLVVTWLLEREPNRFRGQARLQAATLADAPAAPLPR